MTSLGTGFMKTPDSTWIREDGSAPQASVSSSKNRYIKRMTKIKELLIFITKELGPPRILESIWDFNMSP